MQNLTSDQVQMLINVIVGVSVSLVALSGVFATSLVLVVRQNKNMAQMLYNSIPVQYQAIIRSDVTAAKQAIDLADEITAPPTQTANPGAIPAKAA